MVSNTVITLKSSGSTGNVPVGLIPGELAINYTDGKLYYGNATSEAVLFAGGGGGEPGGLDTEIQFNDSGSLNGSANLTFNKTTGTLYAVSIVSNTVNTINSLANNAYTLATTKTRTYFQNTTPTSANNSDVWINTATGFVYENFGNTAVNIWAEFGPSGGGGGGGGGNTDITPAFDQANNSFAQANLAYDAANAVITIAEANVGAGLITTTNAYEANVGAARLELFDYANTKLSLSGGYVTGNVTANNLTANLSIHTPAIYSLGSGASIELSDIGIIGINPSGGSGAGVKFIGKTIQLSTIYGGSYDGNRLSLDSETNLISSRYDIVKIITGTENRQDNIWNFSNNHLIFPDGTYQNTAWTGTDSWARYQANSAYDAANSAVTTGQANVGAGLISTKSAYEANVGAGLISTSTGLTNAYQANVGAGLISYQASSQANVGAGLLSYQAITQANVGAGLISTKSAYEINVGSAIIQGQANVGAGLISTKSAYEANVGSGLIATTSTITSAYQANVGAGLIATKSAYEANVGSGLLTYQAASQANVGAGLIAEVAARQANVGIKLDKTGGTISGDLTVSGNLTITGNTTSLNVSTLTVTDTVIQLGVQNQTDALDIGFLGHYGNTPNNHTGLIRHASDGKYYLFDNLLSNAEPSNVIDVANTRVATLSANIITNVITLRGLDPLDYANTIYTNAQANTGAGLITYQTAAQANVGAGLITVTSAYQANVGSAIVQGQANVGSGLISLSTTLTSAYQANVGAGLITEVTARQANVGSAIIQGQANTGAGLIAYQTTSQANVGSGLISLSTTLTSAYQANVGAGLITEVAARQANVGASVITLSNNITNVFNQANLAYNAANSAVTTGQANVGAGLITITSAYQANVGAGLITEVAARQANVGAGLISSAANINAANDVTTAASFYPVFVSALDSVQTAKGSGTKLYFNPSTGTLNSTIFNSLSDANSKMGVETLENSLEKVLQLRGVSFRWKDNGNQSMGLIAQEVEKIIPVVVNTNENGIKSVSYDSIIGLLVEAIKQQQTQIEELKKIIKGEN